MFTFGERRATLEKNVGFYKIFGAMAGDSFGQISEIIWYSDMDIVKYCQQCFYFDMPSDMWEKRVRTFEGKFSKFRQCI